MESPVEALPTYDRLRQYIRDALCAHDGFAPEQAALKQAAIRRGERTCGLFFQLIGPQRQKAYAVWAGDEHRVLFYDATGARFAEVRLSESPDPAHLDRQAA
jgi:hypothetical protein